MSIGSKEEAHPQTELPPRMPPRAARTIAKRRFGSSCELGKGMGVRLKVYGMNIARRSRYRAWRAIEGSCKSVDQYLAVDSGASVFVSLIYLLHVAALEDVPAGVQCWLSERNVVGYL